MSSGIALRMSTRWLPLTTRTTGVLLDGDAGLSARNAKLLAMRLWGTCRAAAALAAVARLPACPRQLSCDEWLCAMKKRCSCTYSLLPDWLHASCTTVCALYTTIISCVDRDCASAEQEAYYVSNSCHDGLTKR